MNEYEKFLQIMVEIDKNKKLLEGKIEDLFTSMFGGGFGK